MKALAICIVIYLLFFTNMMEFLSYNTWQLPLWIADISWVGLELITASTVIFIIMALAVLIALGLISAGGVVLVGTILVFLFGSLMIAWPLLCAVVLYWLVADNKKVAS
jgi:hypothetical protein